MTKSDARSQLESELLDVVAGTAHETGLRAGSAAERLVDALADRVVEQADLVSRVAEEQSKQ